MAGRGRPGVEPLAEQRELFVSLIAAGSSNSAACRAVGVNRRTGTRWRYGRSIPSAGGGLLHYPPVTNSRAAVVSPCYLSEDERIVIADLHRAGLSSRAMADVQDDPHDELVWDLRALQAADLVSDERAAQAGVSSPVAGFYPSLHLNLGEVYRKLGDAQAARRHLGLGRAAAGALGQDGYSAMIRRGFPRS